MLRRRVPNVSFRLVPGMPPIPDGLGSDLYFEPVLGVPADSAKARKGLKRDLNTGLTATLRQCVAVKLSLIHI